MTSADVIDIYSTLGRLGIQIWIDGGWGVDALLHRQTRPHKDLDIVLEEQQLVAFERFLESRHDQWLFSSLHLPSLDGEIP